MTESLLDQTNRFLITGQFDPTFREWPGTSLLDRAMRGTAVLADALVGEVRRRQAHGTKIESVVSPSGDELTAFTRAKVAPMVSGLFSRKEVDPVLALLEKSVVFLTSQDIEAQIRRADPHTAWEVANIYLASVGAERLDNSSRPTVGFSVETTCYVSAEYFSDEDPFSDFVVHEAAHVFHNCKRVNAGLPERRRCEWLLPIEFRMRETFAYTSEAYSRILERAKTPAKRAALFEQLKERPPPADERVDPNQYLDILGEAVRRQNGWKSILKRCSTDPFQAVQQSLSKIPGSMAAVVSTEREERQEAD